MLFGPNVQCEIAGSAEADWGIIMRVKSNISEKDRIELRRTLSVLEDMLCIFNNFDLSLRQKDAMKSIVATRSNELYARARDLDDLDQWMSAWQNEVVAIHRSLRRSRETVLQTLNTKADLLEADADQLVRKISGERVLVESC